MRKVLVSLLVLVMISLMIGCTTQEPVSPTPSTTPKTTTPVQTPPKTTTDIPNPEQKDPLLRTPFWKTWSNDYITFKYPDIWTAQKMTEKVMGMSPEIVIAAPSGTNINVLTEQAVALAPAAKDYAQATVTQLTKNGTMLGMKNYKFLEFQDYQLGKVKAGLLLADWELAQSGDQIRCMQLIIPIVNKTVIVTFTTTPSRWDSDADVFKAVLDYTKLNF